MCPRALGTQWEQRQVTGCITEVTHGFYRQLHRPKKAYRRHVNPTYMSSSEKPSQKNKSAKIKTKVQSGIEKMIKGSTE